MSRSWWNRIRSLCFFATTLVASAYSQTLVSPTENVAAPPLPEIYQHWLDEDVRYIIKDEERLQFLLLPGDKDHDNFVRAFWERRNPHPGSYENTFKEEHYRRMAYANAHFGEQVAGWQTDRGEIYIVLGPPDEISVQREAGIKAEIWRYREAPSESSRRELRFVDRCNCGHYALER